MNVEEAPMSVHKFAAESDLSEEERERRRRQREIRALYRMVVVRPARE